MQLVLPPPTVTARFSPCFQKRIKSLMTNMAAMASEEVRARVLR